MRGQEREREDGGGKRRKVQNSLLLPLSYQRDRACDCRAKCRAKIEGTHHAEAERVLRVHIVLEPTPVKSSLALLLACKTGIL